jgi:hypothetical protein
MEIPIPDDRSKLNAIMDDFSQMLAEKIVREQNKGQSRGGASRGGGSASTPPPRGDRNERSRLGFDVDDGSGGFSYTSNPSGEASSGASNMGESVTSSVQSVLGRDPQRLADLRRKHEEKKSAQGGMLPSFFGGSVNWQQAATGLGNVGYGLSHSKEDGGYKYTFNPEGRMGRATAWASEKGYQLEDNALGVEAIKHGLMKASRESNKLTAYGQSLGANPAEGFGSHIGPMRLPFINPAARKGISASLDSGLNAALTPGISMQQDLKMKAELTEMGWYDGTKDADTLLGDGAEFLGIGKNGMSGMREIMSKDPALMTETAKQMMDQSLRSGISSMEEFNATLFKTRDAAMAANVSVEQMQVSMQAMGEWSAQHGGTRQQGYNSAVNFSQATGMPAEVGQTLLENQYVTGRIYRDTGVMPEMQGLLSPATLVDSQMSAVNEMYNNVGTFGTQTVRDKQGNVIDIVSGREQKAAMTAEALGLDPEKVRSLMESGDWKKYQLGQKAQAVADGSMDAFGEGQYARMRGSTKAMRNFNRMGIKGTKKAAEYMRTAEDIDGEKLYDEDVIEGLKSAGGAVKDMKFDGAYADASDMSGGEQESVAKWLEKQGAKKPEGMSDKEFIEQNMSKRQKKLYAAQHKAEYISGQLTKDQKKMQDDEEIKAGNVIELGPHARKFFQIQDGQSAYRAGGPKTYSIDPSLATGGVNPRGQG